MKITLLILLLTSTALAQIPTPDQTVAGVQGMVQSLKSLAATTQQSATQIQSQATQIQSQASKISSLQTQLDALTINHGVSQGQSIQATINGAKSGDTITINTGIYRESLSINVPNLTLAANGNVILDGADPAVGWTADGTLHWIPWTHVFTSVTGTPYRLYAPADAVKYGMSECVGYAEQVIRGTGDGIPLKQVLQRAACVDGTFYIDYAAKRLYVAGSIDNILTSTRSHLLTGSATDVHIKGLVFQHSANFAQDAAIQTKDRWTFDKSIFRQCNAGAIAINGDSVLLTDCFAKDNGQLGFSGSGSNCTLLRCGHSGDNYRGFTFQGEASIKFAKTKNLTLDGFAAFQNHGNGIWLDSNNTGYKIINSDIHDNEGDGIITEINPGPGLIAHNHFRNNKMAGICVAESMGVTIDSNTFDSVPGLTEDLAFRLLARPPYTISGEVVTNNTFNGGRIRTDVGTWLPSTVSVKGNHWSNAPVLVRWAAKDYKTLADVQSLGWEKQ